MAFIPSVQITQWQRQQLFICEPPQTISSGTWCICCAGKHCFGKSQFHPVPSSPLPFTPRSPGDWLPPFRGLKSPSRLFHLHPPWSFFLPLHWHPCLSFFHSFPAPTPTVHVSSSTAFLSSSSYRKVLPDAQVTPSHPTAHGLFESRYSFNCYLSVWMIPKSWCLFLTSAFELQIFFFPFLGDLICFWRLCQS